MGADRAAGVLLLAGCGFAQSFNVDIGPNSIYPVPPPTYGAAAAQPGTWHAWVGSAQTALVSIDGAQTSVLARYLLNPGGFGNLEVDIPGSSGYDELLMDDFRRAQTTFGSIEQIRLSGLWDGNYEVFSYCFDGGPSETFVRVIGSPDPGVTLGSGSFPGTHVEGVTYARHRVTVAGGVLTIEIDTANNWFSAINGFQVRWIPPAPASYCTAKLNSLGCLPALQHAGAPSASAGSGFLVSCANVRNAKAGLLLYGTTGRAALAFQGGWLCVASPVRRTPGTSSGGTAPPASDCSGIWQIDFNAFASGSLGGNPAPDLSQPGVTIDVQWWGRDPGFAPPNNTALSDGLEFAQGF